MHSPIVTEWTWSPLVVSAVEDNRALIDPALISGDSQRAPLRGLLALHIRRGDYAGHCKYLIKHHTPFHGFNQHPSFPDKFSPPPGDRHDKNVIAFYNRHCMPSMDTLIERVMQVRAD